ncbi:hypothetical protein KQQ85_000224 [Staphylococcus pseudintermedius]|nr:hypothetical protein [Staphylococcus pseudintermedius]
MNTEITETSQGYVYIEGTENTADFTESLEIYEDFLVNLQYNFYEQK